MPSRRFFNPASRLLLAVGLLALFSALTAPILAQTDGPRKVLVLNSYHKGYAWSDNIIEGIESVLSPSDELELYIEYMDTKQHFSLPYLKRLRDIYADKYSTETFEVVISSDDNALDFLLANRNDVFPNVPVVFCGLNDFEDARIAGQERITGVNEAPDFAGNVELVLDLHPKTRRIAVISGQTMTGKTNIVRFGRIAPDFANRVEFELLTDKTVSELQEALRSLPGDNAVLLMGFLKDRAGESISYRRSVRLVAESCDVPLYTCWDFQVIDGVLGGKVMSGFEQGKTAAWMAQRVLDGESAESIPIVRESPNVYMFDYEVMRRFGLGMSDLPAGSVVLNRPVSFYSRYWRELWAATVFMVLQSLLILRLLYSGRMRKRAQNSLATHLKFLRVLIDTVPSPFFYKDRKGKYRGCNTAFAEQVMGIERDRIIGRSMRELPEVVPDDLAEEHTRYDEELYKEEGVRTYEADVQCADGSRREFLISKAVFRDTSGHVGGLVGVMMDLSRLRRAEAALRESEKRFRDISENALEWIWEVDAEGVYTYASPVVEKILGYTPDEVLGKHFYDLFHPDDREELKHTAFDVLSKKQCFREFLNKNIHKNGQEVWLSTGGVPVVDEDGNLLGYRGADTDITKRKQAEEERRKLEAQIQQAQKLESLGVLAGGIAHDFNNLLTAILGNADLALSYLSPVSPARENLEAIERTSRRAAELCKQMLAYSGKGRFVIRSVNLSEVVEEMTHLLEVSISKKVVLKYNFADNLPSIKADPTQVRQIIMNLITNASEAIGDRSGVISISTGVTECDRAYLKGTYLDEKLPEGLYVTLEVSDTGCGMDKNTLGGIFDPFFTTKFTGRGLGLVAVLGIVRGHNGAIKIHSEKGRGTTFKVLIPATAGLEETIAAEPTSEKEWQGSGTVLLVEDEEAVRTTGKQMLENAGFDVLTAADGCQGVDVFREQADEIVCVLLDLTMPHKGGEETFRDLRLIRKEVRVILMSGYSEQEVTDRFAGEGLAGFIQKPYQYAELIAELRKALEGR